MKIKLDGKTVEARDNSVVEDLIPLTDSKHMICAAFVNNVVKSLRYRLKAGDDVRMIDISHEIGLKIYESTVLFIFSKALRDVCPNRDADVKYSLGGGIYCEYEDGAVMDAQDVAKIKDRMRAIVGHDAAIKKHRLTTHEADKAIASCRANKTGTARFVNSKFINLYEIEGYFGYFYTKMLGKTGLARHFDIVSEPPGCVLMSIDPAALDKPAVYRPQPNLFKEFQSYSSWCKHLNVVDVTSLNRIISEGGANELITVCEARHEQTIHNIAQAVTADPDIHVILISGPSSAGKTTTSKRLRAHLISKGLYPLTVGTDDYFVDREKTPVDAFGEKDYESIDAIDLERFNRDLVSLLKGNETEVPVFDFMEGRRAQKGKILKLAKGSPLIVEGIHGLNETLTHDIARKHKCKIYINDLTDLNVDQYNRISTSDVRLIRRIVRDSQKRGNDALATISMWQSVRRGEQKNIFPYSNEADHIFNTSLVYELAVLKKYAEPVLSLIDSGNPYYYEARRLLGFLSFFLSIEDESAIYTISLLREFIGGCVFDNM